MNEYNKLSHTNVLNKNEFNLKIQDFNEIYHLMNKTNIFFDKTHIIINEWFKYEILNNSNNVINQINYILPYTFHLIQDINDTINVYYNIGNLIFNHINIVIYILGLLFILIILIQIITCCMLCLFYKNYNLKKKIKTLNIVNTRDNF